MKVLKRAFLIVFCLLLFNSCLLSILVGSVMSRYSPYMGFSNGYKSWANVYEKRSGEKYLETQFWFINEKIKNTQGMNISEYKATLAKQVRILQGSKLRSKAINRMMRYLYPNKYHNGYDNKYIASEHMYEN